MIVAIHQPGYLPWLPFLEKALRADVFVFLDDVQFEKNSEQNRNRIKTSQGARWLTVPVVRSLQTRIPAVAIAADGHRWRKKHRSAIEQNYGRAPYFDEIAPEIFALLSQDWERLLDLNLAIDSLFFRFVGPIGATVRSSELEAFGVKSDRILAICRELGATVYLSGPAGIRYLDLPAFAASGIEVKVQNYRHIEYPQLYPEIGFIPRLSAIDLLCNVGKGEAARQLILDGGSWVKPEALVAAIE